MNERIRELAKEAEVSRGGMRVVDIEKFAELIVNECCQQLLKEDIRYGGYGYNQYELHNKLREHFGVKNDTLFKHK